MAAPGNFHSDQIALSQLVGYNCNSAGVSGLLTTTSITAADSNAGLQAAVTAAFVHADLVPLKSRINVAIQAGLTDTSLADSVVLNLTTVVSLVAATSAGASTNTGLFLE